MPTAETHQEMILPSPYEQPSELSRLITATIENGEYAFAARLIDRLAAAVAALRDRSD